MDSLNLIRYSIDSDNTRQSSYHHRDTYHYIKGTARNVLIVISIARNVDSPGITVRNVVV